VSPRDYKRRIGICRKPAGDDPPKAGSSLGSRGAVAQALQESQLPQAPPLDSLASTRRAATLDRPSRNTTHDARVASRTRHDFGMNLTTA
jgi:hypothetical protein